MSVIFPKVLRALAVISIHVRYELIDGCELINVKYFVQNVLNVDNDKHNDWYELLVNVCDFSKMARTLVMIYIHV